MNENKTSKRRILSIDGGGILGAFPAAFLAELERELDRPVGSYFDLIAGTSTGGILALGLGMGMRASEILDLYENRGSDIFGGNRGMLANFLVRNLRCVRWCFRNKYDSDRLRKVLRDVFGEKLIGEAKTRLVVPAWNPLTKSVHIYKTAHHPRLRTDYRSSVVDAALATSAAPSYFQQHVTQHGVGLIDGGIWANNPVAVAVVEAIAVLGWPRESLHVLSLGCLDETYSVPKHAGLGGVGLKILNFFMDGQSYGAMGMAKLLTDDGHGRRAICRVDSAVPRGVYKMDDARVVQEMKGLGHSHARERKSVLENVFFDKPAGVFKPYHDLEVNEDDN